MMDRIPTLKYEVDLPMLRRHVPNADGEDLSDFSQNLENAMAEDGYINVLVVQTFVAVNPKTSFFMAFAWPTEKVWQQALTRTFGDR